MSQFYADQCLGFPLKEPRNAAWARNPHKAPIPTRHQIWDHELARIRVISTIEHTGTGRGVEWHLSISMEGGKYPPIWAIEKVKADFELVGFEQDDHGSKVAHLWLPVVADKRGDCDCKD